MFVRLRFLGKVLSVERASERVKDNKSEEDGNKRGNDLGYLTKVATLSKDQREGSKLASILTSEPIAERLGVDYPFPPYLEYISSSSPQTTKKKEKNL